MYLLWVIKTYSIWVASSGETFIQNVIHISLLIQNFNVGMHRHTTYCTRSPFALRPPWLALCGRWNFIQDTGGVHRIHTQSSLFLDVFICVWDVKSTLIQLSKQKSYSHNRKENNCRFSPEIITFVFISWPRYTPPHYTPPPYTPPYSLSSVTRLPALVTQFCYLLLTIFPI